MSIGGDDGITLPKINKYADIRRLKNPSHSVPSWGVFYVVIAERIQDINSLNQCCGYEMFIPGLKQCCGSEMFITDPGSEFFHPGSRVKKIPDPRSGSP
jgi:hypothetical protein